MKRTSLGAVSLLLVLSGCGPTDSADRPGPATTFASASASDGTLHTRSLPSPSPAHFTPTASRPARAVPVTVTRGGGFAGGTETIEVAADGRWTREGSAALSGRLTEAERSRLWTLLADSRFAAEAGSHSRQGCADTYQWTVTAEATTVSYSDCLPPADRPQVAAAVVDLIATATR